MFWPDYQIIDISAVKTLCDRYLSEVNFPSDMAHFMHTPTRQWYSTHCITPVGCQNSAYEIQTYIFYSDTYKSVSNAAIPAQNMGYS